MTDFLLASRSPAPLRDLAQSLVKRGFLVRGQGEPGFLGVLSSNSSLGAPAISEN